MISTKWVLIVDIVVIAFFIGWIIAERFIMIKRKNSSGGLNERK